MSEAESGIYKTSFEQIIPGQIMRDISLSPDSVIIEGDSQIIGGYPKFRIIGNILYYGKQRFTKLAWGRLDRLPKFIRRQGRFARETFNPENEWAIISYWDPAENELIESHVCQCGGSLRYDPLGYYCEDCGLMRIEKQFDFEALRNSKTMAPATWRKRKNHPR